MSTEVSSVDDTRVRVVDDHAVFRYGMRAMLANAKGFEVVGEAATGEEAVEKAAEMRPDIVLMDIQMPGMNGIEATRRILQANPRVRVVVVTMFGDDESVFLAMRVGARGYVLKGADADEVMKVLSAVANGEAHFGGFLDRLLAGRRLPDHLEAFGIGEHGAHPVAEDRVVVDHQDLGVARRSNFR